MGLLSSSRVGLETLKGCVLAVEVQFVSWQDAMRFGVVASKTEAAALGGQHAF
jgi:hypothetical protein